MITTEMARNAAKLLGISVSEERFAEIAPALSQTMELIHPLLELDLPKETETTTYLSSISARTEEKKHETK